MKMIFKEFEPDPKLALKMGQPEAEPADEQAQGFTADEVETQIRLAREEAWKDGFEAGKSQAQTEADQAINLRIEEEIAGLTSSIQTLLSKEDDIRQEAEEEWAALTLEIAERIVPEFQGLYATQAVSQHIKEALKISDTLPSLTLRIAPETEARLGDELRTLANDGSSDRKLTLVVDAAMGAGQVQAQWKHGALSYDLDTACQSLLEILRTAVKDSKNTG